MIRYILTKIKNKYKLYLCLMIGNISIIMIFAMIMMFRDGSRMKLIQRGFSKQQEQTQRFPAYLYRSDVVKGTELVDLPDEQRNTKTITDRMKSYEDSWNKYLELPVLSSQRIIYYRSVDAEFSFHGSGRISFGCIDDGLLSDDDPEGWSKHYHVVQGADLYEDISEYTDQGIDIPEDAIPCLVGQYTADLLNLVPGELIYIKKVMYGAEESDDPVITLYINGIITEKADDYFWHKTLEECGAFAIVDKKDFDSFLMKYEKDTTTECYESFDYRYIDPSNVFYINNIIRQFKSKDANLEENITPIISEFKEGSKSVEQMLYVIVLPLIVLVLIFIGMIAFRIIDSEAGELTTLRSRGLSVARLIVMYIIQAFILAGVSLPIGLLVGFGFGKMVASVDDFMGFSFSSDISVRDYRFNIWMVLAGIAAALIAVMVMELPVLIFFKKKKTRRKTAATPFWEKYFLDVALLAVSVYLLFNYNKQLGLLSNSVMNGEGIDPVIFINATLFLFACGMLMLRIIFYFVKLVYKLGEKRFQPVTYAGFLQIMRTRNASAVISIFLVMTVAMSLFNANMARTINANKEDRLKYECGADMRIKEHWDLIVMGPPGQRVWKYNEPDYENYLKLKDEGHASSVTKVMYSDRTKIKAGGKDFSDVSLMAINTKEFGETANLKDGLTPEHWYNYLNALAAENEGVIISKSLADKYEVKVGDNMVIEQLPPAATGETNVYATVDLKVVAIVDAWPGYVKYKYVTDENGKVVEKENYLAVINYGLATSSLTVLPYEVWVKTDEGYDEVKDVVNESFGSGTRYLDKVTSWKEEIRKEKSTAIIQITNGIFTADFLVALVLCIIGYMIYWITSIRDRELLFGIYRAMGISRGEINKMIGIEQIFLSLMSIFAGVIAGTLASKYFVKLFAAVYLPQKHNVAVFISSYGGDMIKLALVLLVVVLVCVFWIRKIVRGLNITEALKLGDD